MSELARLRSVLTYCSESGRFTWNLDGRGRARRAGTVAGCPNKDGYIRIKTGGRTYLAHRLAWLFVYGVWPSSILDHINGIRTDNRIDNLREVTNQQNLCNSFGRARRASRFKGVSLDKRRGKWRANISSEGRAKFLGSFETEEEAHDAYKRAAIELHGEFARWS